MNVMHGLRPSRIARAGSKAAVLVALLSMRAMALGGSRGGPTAQPAGILAGALHLTFAAQAAIALLVIGRGADPAP